MASKSNKALDAALERLKGLHPNVIDLALDRVLGLLALLGSPERALPPVVHVAGTNGKGSCLAYLRAIVEAAGLRAHVYTSPHLVRFAERIVVAGQIIDEATLLDILVFCEKRNAGRPITFFEATTAAAFVAFARQPADLCLLETGMGGRYDATNVLEKPALTILTPISLDHQAFLGDTVAAIAGEKAGILKRGVPCVSAAQTPEAMAVIAARAAEFDVPLYVEGRDWSVERRDDRLLFAMAGEQLRAPLPPLPGEHQVHNAGLALAAAQILDGKSGAMAGRLPLAARMDGLGQAKWPARLQQLTTGPLVESLPEDWELWLDGGHNPDAGQALSRFIAETWTDRPLDMVAGMLDTKDSHGFFAPMAPYVRRMRTVAIPGEEHSQTATQIASVAAGEGLTVEAAPDVAAAVASLTEGIAGPARILICGSLYLAGTVLAENG